MRKYYKSVSFYMLLFAVLLILVVWLGNIQDSAVKKVYSDLMKEVQAGRVTELVITQNHAIAKLAETKPADPNKSSDKTDRIEVEIPDMQVFHDDMGAMINQQVFDGTIKYYDTQAPKQTPWWATLLPILATGVLIVIVYVFFMQQSQGGGRAMSFGKSRARMVNNDKVKVTFADVAGADEEKAELQEIVEFLKNPRKFMELGARIPKGMLLVGPPGTGKTLLAKAVAGEAGVPFFTISGSDFVEMFVGVGASRVRDLFEQAKKNSPCIVFIDEIDAVGRHRGAGLGGGHDEREQTLNQLLVEMDGFGENENVIIVAATNRPDILDPALLRPGRFDRQVVVGLPDVRGREEILKVHTRHKPLAPEVELSVIAKTTAGFTGADLENLVNEGAILAARNGRKQITLKDLEDSMLKVVMGTEKKSRVVSDHERKLTAFHEAGHAVISKLLPTRKEVHQVSIIPRGMAGGYTMHMPQEDKYYASRTEMYEEIMGLLGGRVAEKLALDDISTGASNDIERATAIARKMVTKYGMSERIGPISFGSNQEVFIGRDLAQSRNFSEKVAADIDDEIKNIINDCYDRCVNMLSEKLDVLTKVANSLLEKEKIGGEELEAIFNEFTQMSDTPDTGAPEQQA